MRGLFQRNKQDSPRQLGRDAEKLTKAAEGAIGKNSQDEFNKSMRDLLGKAEDLMNSDAKTGITSEERKAVVKMTRDLLDSGHQKGMEQPFMIDQHVTQILNIPEKPQSI